MISAVFLRTKNLLKSKWWLILIILGIIAIGAFKIFGPKTPVKQTTYTVKRQTLKETLSFSGTVDAKEKAALRFQTSGYLNWIGVKEGDTVRKYQTLASLDAAQLQKQMQKELNAYVQTRNDFEQNKADNNNNFYTDTLARLAQKYQLNLNNSVLDVELQDLALKYANLWTPIDGVVVSVGAPSAGINITPAQAEIDVVNPATIYFSATADQTDVVKIATEAAGTITLDAFPGQIFTGVIDRIGFIPKTGETGTVYELKINLNNSSESAKLRLGMTGDIEFTIRQLPNALSVPRNYLKTENGKKYVTLKDGQKVFVELGSEFDNDVEIKNGLGEGDIIVL